MPTCSDPSKSHASASAESVPDANLSAAAANFDRLARAYRWLEYLSFGPLLSRCRLHFLSPMTEARRLLLLGDGDGRFLGRLLTVNVECHVDAVDSSAAMLAQLSRRVAFAAARLTLHCCDAREFQPSPPGYDLVVSHFFLDCLTAEEVEALVARIVPCMRPKARWVVSEFAIPQGAAASWLARLLIASLYRLFGVLTGLKTRSLPDYAAAMRRCGLELTEQRSRLGGLLVSELWTRMETPRGGSTGA